jgi:hypothetical protein
MRSNRQRLVDHLTAIATFLGRVFAPACLLPTCPARKPYTEAEAKTGTASIENGIVLNTLGL